MPHEVLRASVEQIVDAIWCSTMAIPLQVTECSPFPPSDLSVFSGVVQISGAWQGAVAVRVTAGLARMATTSMMGIPDAQLTMADVQDTIGEIANMTGGNLKALLPEPCFLGLPVVANGADLRVRIPGSEVTLECAFAWHGHYVTVSVLQWDLAIAA